MYFIDIDFIGDIARNQVLTHIRIHVSVLKREQTLSNLGNNLDAIGYTRVLCISFW